MSISSRRGSDFERKVAAIMRSKLGARVARDRRSGAGTHKADILDYYQDTPLFLELKDQETIKVKEWFRQADAGSSFNQVPTLVFQADEDILATLRFSDLVNFLVEIADQKAEIDDLRAPLQAGNSTHRLTPDQLPRMCHCTLENNFHNHPESELSHAVVTGPIPNDIVKKHVETAVAQKKAAGVKLCRAGHISDQYGYCNQKGCKYSRGYRPPKGKRK